MRFVLHYYEKFGKSVFSPTSLTEGLRLRPTWHASSVQQKKFKKEEPSQILGVMKVKRHRSINGGEACITITRTKIESPGCNLAFQWMLE